MLTKLVINDTDFTQYLKEEGLQLSEEVRQSSEVVSLTGVLYRSEIVKKSIKVDLVELRDTTWRKLLNALWHRPATVKYTDDAYGSDKTISCWISSPTATAKTVRGGITYYSGISFTLTER